MPVYNTENYLGKCIKSLVGQTYNNLEMIIIDDGSTDGGLNICSAYANKFDNIILLYQENQGLLASRNK